MRKIISFFENCKVLTRHMNCVHKIYGQGDRIFHDGISTAIAPPFNAMFLSSVWMKRPETESTFWLINWFLFWVVVCGRDKSFLLFNISTNQHLSNFKWLTSLHVASIDMMCYLWSLNIEFVIANCNVPGGWDVPILIEDVSYGHLLENVGTHKRQ